MKSVQVFAILFGISAGVIATPPQATVSTVLASSSAVPNDAGGSAPSAAVSDQAGDGSAASTVTTTSIPTTFATSFLPSSSAEGADNQAASAASATSSASIGSASTSSTGGQSSTCDESQAGNLVCSSDGTQFALCNLSFPVGMQLVYQDVAAGTTCSGGAITASPLSQ